MRRGFGTQIMHERKKQLVDPGDSECSPQGCPIHTAELSSLRMNCMYIMILGKAVRYEIPYRLWLPVGVLGASAGGLLLGCLVPHKSKSDK